ncbi:ATP-binding cassette domain-containing protein [Alkalitalea saponilacus]|uniref:ABC-2 type transport system ATP-binding protein n=1 Tax=Alkalitalea saponilacus TaxID=889453 RepID=A0A1T5HSD3_9BACT|nr:ATP-binding cassette domain-containing protein [Alkalitalea saponilacus]ASB48372.1 daunorubicin/doxorubicin resistance ABC transporter ATP-binding protein DrrA [Alkalitalea saponilacus]SKC23604.1 ABC-2 type transport system ATP-binding protein [Alkalitalea saponilacus]
MNKIPLAIETENITRYFKDVKAVNGISLKIETGGVYGILGPNGAGKTTLIRMLATLLNPTSGSGKVMGYDIVTEKETIRRLVSLTGQFASVDEDLTGLENLLLLAKLLGYSGKNAKKRALELLSGFGLTDAAKRQVKTYSGGMRRRLDIAASIVVRPALIFLDEPTTGLDPRSRNQVWDIIRSLVADGTTVLLTTQYLDEADQLAGKIAVIDHGKVIAEGTPSQLKASVGSNVLRLHINDASEVEKAHHIIAHNMNLDVQTNSDPYLLTIQTENVSAATSLITEITSAGIEISRFSLGQPSLDEVFLALTGKSVEEENVD